MTVSNLKVLALVPARGGSKSILRKNLRPIAGKPMIAWSIEHGLQSRLISRVVLTTDDAEIAEVGRQHGAEVPFLRPAEISGDFAVDFSFHLHALEWLRDNEGYVPDMVVQLRPTTPQRKPEVIDQAIELFAAHPEADSLRAVAPACFTPYKMWLMEDGYLKQAMTLEGHAEPYNMPRQLLPDIWQQDGYIDITRPSTVFEQQSTTGRRILPFAIDSHSIDIDLEHELQMADRALSDQAQGG